MTKVLPYAIVAFVLVLSGLLGWYRGGTGAVTVNANQGEWRTPPRPDNAHDVITSLKQRIFDSGYFVDPEKSAQDLAAENGQLDAYKKALAAAEKKYGNFPHIISIARVDGIDTAQLRPDDDVIRTVRAGDTLMNGWVIAKVYSDRLEADAGADRFSFAVFEHKSGQEQDNVDEQASQN